MKSLADEHKRVALRDALPLIYESVDINKVGSISLEEFSNYYKSLNVTDDAQIQEAFKLLDVNGNGSISQDGIF